MSYRIESASTGRAGCKNTPCKDAGIKIEKGELRFGVWVTIQEHGSFQWRHWGCVSGRQLENLREYLEQGDPDTGYKWDFFDGLDELSEADQKRVKDAVINGKIADEDWKGDPAYNVLGQTGTQPRKKKVKASDDDNEDTPPTPAKSAAKKGRGKKAKAEDDNDEEDVKPAAKKGRGKKAKTEEDNGEEAKPAVKRERKVKQEVKDESGDEIDRKPAVKRERKVKQEAQDETGVEADVKPAIKKAAAKRNGSKQEKASSDVEVNMADIPLSKAPTKKANNKATKQESNGEDDVKPAKAKKAPAKKKAAATKTKTKKEESGDESEAEAEVKAKPPTRAERAAKRGVSDVNENKKPSKKSKMTAEGKQKEFDDRIKILMQDPENQRKLEEGWGPIMDLIERQMKGLSADSEDDKDATKGADNGPGSGAPGGSDDWEDDDSDGLMDPDVEEALLRDVLGGNLDPWDYRPGWSDDEGEHHLYAMGMRDAEFDF